MKKPVDEKGEGFSQNTMEIGTEDPSTEEGEGVADVTYGMSGNRLVN